MYAKKVARKTSRPQAFYTCIYVPAHEEEAEIGLLSKISAGTVIVVLFVVPILAREVLLPSSLSAEGIARFFSGIALFWVKVFTSAFEELMSAVMRR